MKKLLMAFVAVAPVLNGRFALGAVVTYDTTEGDVTVEAVPEGGWTGITKTGENLLTIKPAIDVKGSTSSKPFTFEVKEGSALAKGGITRTGSASDETLTKTGAGTLCISNVCTLKRINHSGGQLSFLPGTTLTGDIVNGRQEGGDMVFDGATLTIGNNFNLANPKTTIKDSSIKITDNGMNIATALGNKVATAEAVLDHSTVTITANAEDEGVRFGATDYKTSGRLVVSNDSALVGTCMSSLGTTTALSMYGAGSSAKFSELRFGRYNSKFSVDIHDGTFSIDVARLHNGIWNQFGGKTVIGKDAAKPMLSVGKCDGAATVQPKAVVMNILGGEFEVDSTLAPASSLHANIALESDVDMTIANGGIFRTKRSNFYMAGRTGNATVHLASGGTLETTQVEHPIAATGKAVLTIDGGTLKANAGNAAFVTGLTAFNMTATGGAVDTDGYDIGFAQPLSNNVATLVHRWSFNGDTTDSVGGQTASIVEKSSGNVTYVEDGRGGQAVRLAGGATGTSWVNLGSDILPKDADAATVEIWATQRSVQNYSRVFEMGVDKNSFLVSWTRQSELNSDFVRFNDKGTSTLNALMPYTLGTEFHIVITFVKQADGSWKTRVYKQDATTGATLNSCDVDTPTGWSLADMNQTTCAIGHSLHGGDNNDASADYNEVRVWRGELSEAEMSALAVSGPDSVAFGPFEKRGAGTLTLSGANGFANRTVVKAGTLKLATDASLNEKTVLEVEEGAVVDLGGNTVTVAGLSGAGTVKNGTLVVKGALEMAVGDKIVFDAATLDVTDASLVATDPESFGAKRWVVVEAKNGGSVTGATSLSHNLPPKGTRVDVTANGIVARTVCGLIILFR